MIVDYEKEGLMILTVLIIFFAQMTQKAYESYNTEDFQEMETHSQMQPIEKPVYEYGLRILKFITRD